MITSNQLFYNNYYFHLIFLLIIIFFQNCYNIIKLFYLFFSKLELIFIVLQLHDYKNFLKSHSRYQFVSHNILLFTYKINKIFFFENVYNKYVQLNLLFLFDQFFKFQQNNKNILLYLYQDISPLLLRAQTFFNNFFIKID